MTKKKKALLLLPNLLGNVDHHHPYLPASVDKAVLSLDGLIAESEKGGRRYLSRFLTKEKAYQVPISLLNKHTKEEDYDFLLEPILDGQRWGVISDAGLPCIADPGSKLVLRAKNLGIPVQAFVGPSSIFLALMLSGMCCQRFCFWGYLPKDVQQKEKKIKELEKLSIKESATQVFIETPYRNKALLEQLVSTLSDKTTLGIYWDLTLQTQGGITHTVETLKKSPLPNISKRPCVFLINLSP